MPPPQQSSSPACASGIVCQSVFLTHRLPTNKESVTKSLTDQPASGRDCSSSAALGMAGAGEEGQAVADSKKRKQREEREESSEQDCGGADKGAKRTREAAEEQTSTCHQERPEGKTPVDAGGQRALASPDCFIALPCLVPLAEPPDRASAEPPATDASPQQGAKPQEGNSRAQVCSASVSGSGAASSGGPPCLSGNSGTACKRQAGSGTMASPCLLKRMPTSCPAGRL